MSREILSLLPQIKRQLQSYLNEQFKEYNLKSSEIFFMSFLHREGAKSQSELTHQLECDKAHTHRIVGKLIAKNYLQYTGEHEKSRNNKLALTKQGEEISQKFDVAIKNWNKILIKGISKEELESFKKVFEKLLSNAINFKNMEKKNV